MPYESISPRTLIRGWRADPSNALTEVADYDKSVSGGIAGFFSLITLFISVAIYKCFHSAHTREKQEEFLDISEKLVEAELRPLTLKEEENLFEVQIGQFLLRDTEKASENDIPCILIKDTQTNKTYKLENITVEQLQNKAKIFLGFVEVRKRLSEEFITNISTTFIKESEQFPEDVRTEIFPAVVQACELFPVEDSDSEYRAKISKDPFSKRLDSKFGPATPLKKKTFAEEQEYRLPMSQLKKDLITLWCIVSHYELSTPNDRKTEDAYLRNKVYREYLELNPKQREILEGVFPDIHKNEETQLKISLYAHYCGDMSDKIRDNRYFAFAVVFSQFLGELAELKRQQDEPQEFETIELRM